MVRRLCGAGIAAEASADVIRWWVSTPDYRRAEANRIDRRIAARMASLARLRELAPTVFDPDAPLPLAIGAHDQLTGLGLSAEAVGGLLRWWTRRRAYHAALAKGGSRYNLDASVAGPISDEDQAHAGRKVSDRHHASARDRPAGNARRSRT
jgi:sRNA-binding protein